MLVVQLCGVVLVALSQRIVQRLDYVLSIVYMKERMCS